MYNHIILHDDNNDYVNELKFITSFILPLVFAAGDVNLFAANLPPVFLAARRQKTFTHEMVTALFYVSNFYRPTYLSASMQLTNCGTNYFPLISS